MRESRKIASKQVWTLHFWHRTVGVTSALFVLMLAVTGVLLNHTQWLRMDARYVHSPAILGLYGIRVPEDMTAFSVHEHWVILLGGHLYFDAMPVPDIAGDLLGMVEHQGIFVVAVSGELLLFDAGGHLLERLGGAEGVPAGLQQIGVSGNADLVLRAAHGSYVVDLDALHWQHRAVPSVDWAKPLAPPPQIAQQVVQAYFGTALPVERIVLDLHSGRIFGTWGVYVVDTVAVLFLLLAASGVWMWSRDR